MNMANEQQKMWGLESWREVEARNSNLRVTDREAT